MTREELRAITAAGPSVVYADRQGLLNLLDALADAENALQDIHVQHRAVRLWLIFSTGMWLWFLIFKLMGAI